MYKICKTTQSIERQQHISDVLIEMMKSKHFSKISISALCTKSNIPRKSFYRYFDTLEDVLEYTFERLEKEYKEYCMSSEPQVARSRQGLLEIFLKFWISKTDFLEAICNNAMVSILVKHLIRTNIDNLKFFHCVVTNDDPKSVHDTIAFFICGITHFLINHHQSNDLRTPEEIVNSIAKIFSTPFIVTIE